MDTRNAVIESRRLRRLGKLDDSERMLSSLGEPSRLAASIERAFIQLERRSPPEKILEDVLNWSLEENPTAEEKARLALLEGIVHNRLEDSETAVDRLQRAARLFSELGDIAGEADAFDQLGVVFAWLGRPEKALTAYTRALARWTECGDDLGRANTLGNLGRFYLEACQWRVATEFLELALLARTANPKGREPLRLRLNLVDALLGDGRAAAAHPLAVLAEREASESAEPYMAFLAQRAVTLGLIRERRLEEAERAMIELARRAEASGADYEFMSAESVRGELLLATGDKEALIALERAAAWFAARDLTTPAATTELLWVHALVAHGGTADAESVLNRAIQRARAAHLPPLVRKLREARVDLGLAEPLAMEQGRPIVANYRIADTGYVRREQLGGRGGFGGVWRAYDIEADREVALKILDLSDYDPARRSKIIQSARQELKATAQVDHPGIAKVHAIGQDASGHYYVCQELVRGDRLTDVMQRSFDMEIFRRVLGDICHALTVLHEKNVLHRDLKPDNIVLRGGVKPVLVDFGIAHLGPPGSRSKSLHGTPYYWAPEHYFGGRLDSRTDLYSLGVIAFQWLTSGPTGGEWRWRFPFGPEPPRFWQWLRIRRDRIAARKMLLAAQSHPSPDLVQLVLALLAWHRSGRPRSASDVARVLSQSR